MSLGDYLLSALESLRGNVLRSLLTTLGIMIGVAALIAMMAVGSGARERMDNIISSLGSNVFNVVPGSRRTAGVQLGAGSMQGLTEHDVRAIADEIEGVKRVGGALNGSGQLIVGGTNWFTQIQAVTADYPEATGWTLAQGRWLDEDDDVQNRRVMLLGSSVATQLFPAGDALGREVRVERARFQVVGVLEGRGQTGWGRDQDDVVLLPMRAGKRSVLGVGGGTSGADIGVIAVQTVNEEWLAFVQSAVEALLRDRHDTRPGQPDSFQVRNLAEIIRTRTETMRVMTILLAAVASISLIVGGIGIMNIMLVSVTERTREIGVRMAVGARARDIRSQFIAEAAMLSMLGGVIGVALGTGAAVLMARLTDWPIVLNWENAALAAGFAAIVGMFFGYYPALRASRLSPMDALRTE